MQQTGSSRPVAARWSGIFALAIAGILVWQIAVGSNGSLLERLLLSGGIHLVIIALLWIKRVPPARIAGLALALLLQLLMCLGMLQLNGSDDARAYTEMTLMSLPGVALAALAVALQPPPVAGTPVFRTATTAFLLGVAGTVLGMIVSRGL